ncbi:MAG TPA: zinc-dependent alcohol dehydrogenase family protein [Bryobacteraceae bacterium]|nr:zinc-dependent alcohol dehydrogenase family protein [Bryobacteraceae bacterium]
MRAYFVDEPGGPFRSADVPRPAIGSGQILIRVQASGLNPLDTKIRLAKADHARQPLPAVLGLDMAGIVEEMGSDVVKFGLGDEVYGMVGGVGGLQGTLAEFIAADETLVAHKPKNLSMREAAVLPLSVITAWEGLVDRANVRSGQKVLVHAGAGGVGHIAAQLARALGAEVFATVSSDKAEIVKRFGVTPIDYRRSSVEEYVAAHTAGQGFDIVYDTVGGATLDASFTAVKRYTGHVVSSLGWGTHVLAPLSFRAATYSGVFTLLPLITGEARAHHGEILRQAAALAEATSLKPLLSKEHFSASGLEAAFAVVESGSLGKVAIEM